jgi:uroporphyrinogen-III decarboxylase
MFEKVDIKRAKETVGKVACICGTLPNALLAFGTKEQVINETRRQLDILAPGGGFIMDCSIMLDNAKHENMHAWRETTLKYGEY